MAPRAGAARRAARISRVTSGTLFAHHKLPLRTYLAAIAIFCNEVKGKSALALSRDLDVQYKTAFVLAHKLREAMAAPPPRRWRARSVSVYGRALIILPCPLFSPLR